MRVSELMSRDVVTIGDAETCHGRRADVPPEGASPASAGPRGRARRPRTDRDVRHRLFAPDVYRQIGEIPVSTLLRQAPIRGVMSTPVRCISAAADVADAAERMRRDKVGCLPVVEGPHVVGMLTEIDVLRSIVGTEASGSPELDIVISYP